MNVTTNVLFPLEGQTVPPDFEVMLEVAAHPLGAFQVTKILCLARSFLFFLRFVF